MKHLWLFDIDGILVDIEAVHVAAYKEDYRNLLKVDVPKQVLLRAFGLPEAEMHKKMLKELDIPYSEEAIEKFLAARTRNFERHILRKSIKPLDGVIEFLEFLRNNSQYMGCVTGNSEHIAQLILKQANLHSFFQIVSCAKGKMQRWQIVLAAINKAKQEGYDFEKAIVLGDTLHDIKAGKKAGARTIAVATGHVDFQRLQAAQPDIALKSLKEYRKITENIEK